MTDIIRTAIDRMYQQERRTMNTEGNVVWLYEDNAGGLFIGSEKGPWFDMTGVESTFAADAEAYANKDTLDWTVDRYDEELSVPVVAKWEDGAVTVFNSALVGSAPAGHAASVYLGIKPE